uniref:Col_cuticle_N domain-containing protein n=1 Tax=Steinernema glaseri TaxID=37863 RepID=A0A1I7YLM9_9BILA
MTAVDCAEPTVPGDKMYEWVLVAVCITVAAVVIVSAFFVICMSAKIGKVLRTRQRRFQSARYVLAEYRDDRRLRSVSVRF